jgi:putative effector of murein hydrolase LrgA (UPF0299 family)
VREFYRMNSGFFLLFGTLAFGFMSEIEHKALAQFFVSSVPSLMIPVAVWIMYLVKVLRFNNGELQMETNRFLFNIQFLSTQERVPACTLLIFLQFLPALAYGVFLIGMASEQSAYGSIMIIVAALAVIWASGVTAMLRYMQNPYREVKVSAFKRFLDRHYVRHPLQFYVEWLLRKFPFMLGAIKFMTGALLFAVSVVYRHEAFDWRFLAMAITTCGVANLLLVFHLVSFEHFHFGWTKSLPLKRSTRFTRLLIVVGIFLIPECVILVKYFPAHLPTHLIAQNVIYLLSLIAFFLGFFHTRTAPLEYFTRKVFWIYIVIIILILFRTPLVVLAPFNLVAGYVLFYRNYYQLEFTDS